jgi:hypothetical protein
MGLLGDIVSQFQSLVSLENVFGGNTNGSKSYPEKVGDVSRKAITNDPSYTDKSWKESRGYAFLVVRNKPDGGSKTAENWKEFRLQINPQELTQDEIFAIEVTPTLRGVVVEHHGTVLKDINISGTTGISPMRREGGANKNTGNPLLTSGRSGFEEFHELRSYFRMYVEQKRVDQRKDGELRLVFKNFKDQEFLYVEPQKFSMKRSASRPMLYDYQIALKAIGNATDLVVPESQGLDFLQKTDALLESVQDTLDTTVQVISGAFGIIARVERNVQDTLLNPLRKISQAIEAFRGGSEMTFGERGITRRFADTVRAELIRINDNCADAFGIKLGAYNLLSGRNSTLTASVGRKPTYQEQKALNSLQKANAALLLFTSQRELFDENVFQTGARVTNAFNGKVVLETPNTVRPVQILGTDTIQTLAARELGNVDKFREIVILNNLKPPYISATGGPGVLKPGDQILLPQTDSSRDTGVMQNKVYNIQREMSEIERALGVDMQLNGDGDIAISNIGDASLVGGVENVGQAIATKLLLEVGSLKRHTGVGTDLGIGRKVRSNFLNDLQSQILTSLGQDPRVESVPFIQLKQEGGTTIINMLVKIAKINQPVPIPLTLQTG